MKLWPVCVFAVLPACVGGVGSSAGPGSEPPGGRPTSPGQTGGGDEPSTGGMSPGTGMPIPMPPPTAERPRPAEIVTTRFARLSHRQWENTVRDLLKLPDVAGLAAKFSSDTA